MVNVPISFPTPGLVGDLEDCAIVLEDTVTVCTLYADPEEDLLKMPNISQGILDDLLPNQEASKGLNLEESLLRSKKFLCPILAKSTGLHQNGKRYISPTRPVDGCRVTDWPARPQA